VFSEVLYYLDGRDLAAMLYRALPQLVPGADLVAVDLRPATLDAPRAADDAHRQLLARSELELLVATARRSSCSTC
jgi:hypothetical protein